MVAFLTRKARFPGRELVNNLVPQGTSTVVQVNAGIETKVLGGKGHIEERIGPLTFRLSAVNNGDDPAQLPAHQVLFDLLDYRHVGGIARPAPAAYR